MPKRMNEEVEQTVMTMYRDERKPAPVIAAALGIGSTSVYRVLARHGLKGLYNRTPEEQKGKRLKLSPDVEQELARRYAAKEPTRRLVIAFGVCSATVREIARRHGIEVNPRGQQYRQFTDDEVAEMKRLWESGLSQTAIAQRFGSGQTTISKVLSQHGHQVETRRPRGEEHGSWKGGRSMHPSGYWQVHVPVESPFASMRTRSGYVLEHRLVMAEQLGRRLMPYETVHHINGDKLDNRPENLQLRIGQHGKSQVYCCADCGSRNIVPCPIPEG